MPQWNPKEKRHGLFGEYRVAGVKFENESGDEGWRITSSKSKEHSEHEFWVMQREFHAIKIDFFHNGGPTNLLQIYVPSITAEIEQAERNAMLQAIDEWEQDVEVA
jgi:hypothetical protein